MDMPALLFVHVALAAIGLASGFAALLTPKGGRPHRIAGLVFVPTMLVMTATALVLALLRDGAISIVPALLTFHLVATGWRTVARKDGLTGPIDIALAALALVAAIIGYGLGALAAQTVSGTDGNGFPAAAYFVFASIALFAALLDISVHIRHGVRAGHRLARHLWRMGVAMFIATTSFFQGQERVFPEQLHGSLLLQMPAYMVLAVMGWWLLRLMFRRPPKRSRIDMGTVGAP